MSFGAIAVIAVTGYLLLAGTLFLLQRRLMYFPVTQRLSPQDLGLAGVEEIEVSTRDTRRLLAWYAAAPEGRPTILYFHGNGGSLATRAARLDYFRRHGYGVLLTTYRGYSGSSDTPAEQPIRLDALYFYHWLQARGVGEDRIVLYGESLGTSVAISTACHHRPAAVILEAPFSSIAEVAAAHYWYVPARWFLMDPWRSDRLIGEVTAPVLMLHGEADEVVPIRFAKKLFERANQPKEAAWLSDAGHHDLYSKGAFELIQRFIDRHVR
jgi:fermentation-respiration switch protein FrsA (DUF1100 family)